MSEIQRKKGLLVRLLAASVVGLAIAGTAYLCAYYELRWHFDFDARFDSRKLRRMDEEIQEHRRKTGHLPLNLAELKEGPYRRNDSGQPMDRYNRLHHYRIEGDGYELFSFGRDGQLGGVGLDAEIYPNGPNQPATLYQFSFDLPTEGPQQTCILAGVCAGLVCLLQTRQRGWGIFFMRLGGTAVGAVLAAIAISVVHIPSGH